MSQEAPQTYASHRRFVPLFHFVAFGILVVNLIARIYYLIRIPGFPTALDLAVAIALLLLAFYARTFPLVVQNRVIRFEERQRLERLLPADLQPRIGELSTGQLIGLRFASDAELPDLVRQALEGSSGEAIKKRIKTWRPDHLRA